MKIRFVSDNTEAEEINKSTQKPDKKGWYNRWWKWTVHSELVGKEFVMASDQVEWMFKHNQIIKIED